MYRKNTAGQFVCFGAVNATTGAPLTGATVSIRRCIDGTFAAGGATITEDTGLGFYKAALTQADTNGNDIAYFFTATNMVPICINIVTTAADPTDGVRFGLTALPNATAGANTGLPVVGTQIPNATAGAANGLVIAGSNAATTFATLTSTGAFSINGTSNVAQTGDSYARLGAPAGASIAADIATTNGRLTSARAGYLDNLNTGVTLTSAEHTAIAGDVLNATATSYNTAGTIGNKINSAASAGDPWTTALPGAYSAGSAGYILGTYLDQAVSAAGTLTSGERNAVADALLARNVSGGSSSGRTVKQALHILRNKWTIVAGTQTVYDTDDTTPSWTQSVTGTAGADPITSVG